MLKETHFVYECEAPTQKDAFAEFESRGTTTPEQIYVVVYNRLNLRTNIQVWDIYLVKE